MNKNIMFMATDEMYEELQRQAENRDMSMSALIRLSIAEWLRNQGRPVKHKIAWGGLRRDGNGNQEPEN